MKLILFLGIFLATGCLMTGIRNKEIPIYKVIHLDGKYEIREYTPFLIAKTTVEGDYNEATSVGFRRMAG